MCDVDIYRRFLVATRQIAFRAWALGMVWGSQPECADRDGSLPGYRWFTHCFFAFLYPALKEDAVRVYIMKTNTA
jgi:hypothetical protein